MESLHEKLEDLDVNESENDASSSEEEEGTIKYSIIIFIIKTLLF